MTKKLSIIVPVYNENNTLEIIIKKLINLKLYNGTEKEIIIIDDFSNDGSREIIKNYENNFDIIKAIYKDENKGKGDSQKLAKQHVTGDYVIIQDADLEYDPNDYVKLLNKAVNDNEMVVYGSRILNKKNNYSTISFYLGGLLVTFFTNLIFRNSNLTDQPTCYKLFKSEIIKNINLTSKGFEFCSEVTAKILKKNINIVEVPINYYPRKKKDGKKIKWTDGLIALKTLIKCKLIND